MNRNITTLAGAAALGLGAAGCGSSGSSPPPAPVTVTHTRIVTAAPEQDTVTAKPRVITVTPKAVPAPTQAAPAPTQAAPAPTQAAPAPTQASNVGLSDPVAVVTQFYADITAHDYGAAWALGGDNIAGTSYANWVAGYGTTAAITVTSAENFGSDQATVSISAAQTDGSVSNYTGTYTVQNGVIVSAQIAQQ